MSGDYSIGKKIVHNYEVSIIADYDVVIVGAGVAGISAAVAASRNGMKTLLVERDGCVGGTATTGLMVVFMGVSFSTIRGNCKELIDRLERKGAAFVAENTPFDPEVFKFEAEQWLLENNVDILYHAAFSDVLVENDCVKGIFLQMKEGMRLVLAKIVIDTTGDADVAAAAGVDFQFTNHVQPMTSIFRMDNVNTPEVISYIESHKDQFFSQRGQITWKVDHNPPFFTLGGFFDLIKEGKERGELVLPHDSIWLGPLPRAGQYYVNTTRIGGMDGTSSIELSKAEIEMRKQAWNVAEFMKKNIPGFENAEMLDIAVRVGVRETRKIIGEYILTGEDLESGASFKDAIAIYDFPMDIHGAVGKEETHSWGLIDKVYDIPYRCLIPTKVENILVAGRCISSDSRAHGSTRSMPCCMATGEAAGVAASLAIKSNVVPRNVNVENLRALLQAQGVLLR